MPATWLSDPWNVHLMHNCAGIFAAPMFANSLVAPGEEVMPVEESHRVLGKLMRASVGKTPQYRHTWRVNDLV